MKEILYVQLFDATDRLKKARPQSLKKTEVVVNEIAKEFLKNEE
jgi:hypothetical protein